MDNERPAIGALEELLLGDYQRYTSHDVARLAGVPFHRARRFWRALGLPNVEDEAVEFTHQDFEALLTLLRLVEDGIVDEQGVLQLTRALGQVAARLADSQAELVVDRLDSAGIQGNGRVRTGESLARRVLPDLERLLVYAWRRQLAVAASRLLNEDQEATAGWLAVGFADLVGYTRLSRRLEDDALAHLVERFEGRSADLVVALGGRVVKTLGDSVMFCADTAEQGAEIALRLIETHAAEKVVPPLRVGLDVGTVITRMGDVFGTTVNLASRLTAIAEPNRAVVGPALTEALRGHPRYAFRPLGPRTLRGLGEVEPSVLSHEHHV